MTRVWGVAIVFVFLLRTNVGTRPTASMDYDADAIAISCYSPLELDSGSRYEYPPMSHKSVYFNGCPLPTSSYAADLAALNVNVSAVEQLLLSMTDKSQPLRADYFEGLTSIKSLDIYYLDNGIGVPDAPRPSAGFLEPLTSLARLYITNMEIPSLAVTTSVVDVLLERGGSIGKWGGCKMMEQLTLLYWNVEQVPEGWLSHCPTLYRLTLQWMDRLTGETLQRVTSGVRALRELTVRHCELKALPRHLDILADSQNLQRLDLSDNRLHDVWISWLPNLRELYLSENKIKTSAVIALLLHQLNGLRTLRLSNNRDLDLCSNDRMFEVSFSHPKLEVLDLSSTATQKLCFEGLESLQYLHLNFSKITVLNFKGIPMSRAPVLRVYLESNPVQEVLFDKADYKTINNKTYRNLAGDNKFLISEILVDVDVQLKCDCKYEWLARALRDLPRLSMPDVTCKNGTYLAKTAPERLKCDMTKCPVKCTCRTTWGEKAIDADCRGADLMAVPFLPGLRTLIAPDNRIKSINGSEFNDTLIWLDLSSNHLARLEPEAVHVLFRVSERRVRLAGNPFVCDCDSRPFIEAVQAHHSQVEDYDEVTCVDDETPLRDVVTSDLCKGPPGEVFTVALVLCGVLVAALALAAAAYCRYERQLKVFLYAHGCWLPCTLEEELDADRRFDAFVSFSHADEDYIFDRLMPGLEGAPHAYKVCIHYRDWIPGEFIPAQITHSVEQSRRTIIVLSKNYLASPWGLLKFRSAHEDTLRGGRPRIIIILLEDVVNDERLGAELRGYLRSNTYLKHDDPWFWRKLRYALPHRRGRGGDVTRDASRRHSRPVVQLQALRET